MFDSVRWLVMSCILIAYLLRFHVKPRNKYPFRGLQGATIGGGSNINIDVSETVIGHPPVIAARTGDLRNTWG